MLLFLLNSFSSKSADKQFEHNFIEAKDLEEIDAYPEEVRALEGVEKLKFIYLHFRQRLFKLAYLYLKDAYLAEDVVSDVMVKLAPKVEKLRLDHPKELSSYLYLVTKSSCIDLLKKREREISKENLLLEQESRDWHSIFDLAEEYLSRLSKRDAEILRMVALEDRTINEAALALHINPEAAKKRYQRAKHRFLKIYQEG